MPSRADRISPRRARRLLLAVTLLCTAALLLCSGEAFAQDAAGRRAAIVVGGDSDYPPYEFLDNDGKPAGFNVDLTKAIGEAMGLKLEISLFDWSQLHQALEEGRVDVLQRIPASNLWLREADLTPPHTIITHAIFARKGTPPVDSLEELSGKKVIVHPGGSMNDILTGLGFEKELIFSSTPMDGLRLLAAGVGDYAVVPMLPGLSTIAQKGLSNVTVVAKSVTSQPYGFAVKRGNDKMLALFNEGLALIKQSGRYKEIRRKWFGVMEGQTLTWDAALKYAAIVLAPLLALLGGTVLWSRSLKKQVTQRTKSLSDALEALRNNQQQLVQADKMAALGVLVSGVAHEINNPNGLILLNLPILKKLNAESTRVLDDLYQDKGDFALGGSTYSRIRTKLPRILEVLEESAQRIRRIVDDLKDFSRFNVATDKEPFDINDVVKKTVRLMATAIRKSTNRFTVHYADDLPTVSGNPSRIEQVVVNLMLNSCQALPDADRAIAVSTAFDREAGAVTVTVVDEGAGVAPEDLPRLTDPFFTTKRAIGGTGLGLSVSAGIVKEHGGTLQFASIQHQGTTAKLSLPVVREKSA
ncbi:MAG: transporter substrate-binding domain-containing protein [Solidesulfovibrio sp.]